MAAGKAYSKQSVKKTGRERKEKLVAELTDRLNTTNGLVFTDYKGITHQQLETLKRELKKDDSTIIIAKNSLMKLSLGNSNDYKEAKDNEALDGPVATLFIKGDMVQALKKLQKTAKESGLPKVKFGVLEGQVLDEAAILKIASLPGRETLLAQFVAMLNSPIQGFVSGLAGIPQKFVMTLDAVAKAKPTDRTPTPTTDDKPAEEKVAKTPAEEKSEEKPAEESKEETTENETPKEEATEEKTEETPKESEEKTAEVKDETNKTEDKEGQQPGEASGPEGGEK